MKHSDRKRGRPTKANPELIESVLADIALGLTREMACVANGISLNTWQAIEKRKQYPGLRARALAARIKYLLQAMEENRGFGNWKVYAWMLERTKAYEGQFADPSGPKIAIVNQHNDNRGIYVAGPELEEARTRLDQVKERQRERELRSAITDLRERGIKPEDDASVAEP
jgi:hypothetical protein